jgi:anti-sigma factor RsiW
MTTVAGELSCRELVDLVTEYLEGELPRSERDRFDAHIAGCDACTSYLEQIRRTIDLTGRLTPDSLEPRIRDALLAELRDWKRPR